MAINVCTSLSDDMPKSINFTETLDHRKKAPRSGKRDDLTCFWLKAEWNQNDNSVRQTHIIPYFVGVVSHAGCRITGSWNPSLKCIRFRCFCAKLNDVHTDNDHFVKRRPTKKLKFPDNTPVERVRKTQRPSKLTEEESLDQCLAHVDETICKFSFRVYWESDLERWYIPQMQSGCKCHNGHPHVDHPLLRIQPRHALPSNELDVATSSLNSNIGPSQTAALIHNQTGILLDWNQADYMRRKERMAALANDQYSSSADKLIHQLTQPGISSVCLFAQYNSGLLTIRKKNRAPNSTAVETTDFEDDLGDDTESPRSFAEAMEVTIRDKLTQKSTGMILLVATWTTDDNRRKFDMFPEFLSGDDTEGVNVEERPMNTWCGKDSNNQIFPVLHTFLPSTAQWAKTFVCRSAKVLLTGTGLSRVIKFNTDANKEETRAIGNALARGKKGKRYSVESVVPSQNDVAALPVYKKPQISNDPFPSVLSMMTSPNDTKIFTNAMQGWCGFHKVNRNFTHSPVYKSILNIEQDKDILGRIEIDIIVRWM